MYQPQMRDELIRRLYRVSQAYEMPMTKMLNHIVSTALDELEGREDECTIVIPNTTPNGKPLRKHKRKRSAFSSGRN
jgi:hypothetical protein